jgi:hypothetical protein
MYEKVLQAHKRYVINSNRVAGLMTLVMSSTGEMKPKNFMTYSGVSADVIRAIVVFLHATVEDLIRTQIPKNEKFTFQGRGDIEKAMKKIGRSAAPLRRLYNPLTQLARRRTRIVHYGDMPSNSSEPTPDWGIEDVWCLLQWTLAVNAFAYLLLEILTEPNEVFSAKYHAMFKAMDDHVAFGNLLAKFPKGDITAQQETLQKMSDQLTLIGDSLNAWKK